MKKLISMLMVLALLASLAACGSSAQPETTLPNNNGSQSSDNSTPVEELLNQVIALNPVEFMGGVVTIDLADTSDDGLWNLKRFTGLDSAEGITEAAAFEPMMGSLAFSMVMVRVAQSGDVKAVAETMKANIDPAKWVCVMADDIQVAAKGNVIMFIMVDTFAELASQPFVDAFSTVMGGTDFVM